MSDILFVDIEVDRNGIPRDFGAVFGTKELHSTNVKKLGDWMLEATVLCGHNIIAHDIPYLEKQLDRSFGDKVLIDTLLWSPLIFSQNPYHALTKGYKLINEQEVNNPLSDAKLTRKLLNQQLNALDVQGAQWKSILKFLLGEDVRFNGLFEQFEGSIIEANAADIFKMVNGKICSNVYLNELIALYPVELAYTLSVIRLEDTGSVLPKWVVNAFPKCKEVFHELRYASCSNNDCSYCSEHLNPKKALQNYFTPYKDFRKFDESRSISLQEEAVNAGLDNESFVAVFPTGGGKSLTFQLPALMRGAALGELTVVVSPLVSLMKDQVDNLRLRFGINQAVSLNGLLTPLERDEIMSQVENGFAQILYVSPETLRSPTVLRLLRARQIKRFVIDEAHCLSSWGQDFRVDYLFIAAFIKLLEQDSLERIQVSCFTATAKPQVIQDIKTYFKSRLNLDLSEFKTAVGRKNLSYKIIKAADDKEKLQKLRGILEYCEKPVIIYASRTKKVEELSGVINQMSVGTASYFHGKLEVESKKESMRSFMKGEVDIMVATSAFGMGVDKDNVHTVIHYNISDSLENYTQEAGRAGRDSKIDAKCYVLFSEQDLANHFSLLRQSKLNRREIESIWQAVRKLTKYRNNVSQSALEIAKKAGWDSEMYGLETRVTTAIAALEYSGFLKRNQNSPRVFADSLLVSSYVSGSERIEQDQALSVDEKEQLKRVLKRIVTDKDVRVDLIADRLGLRTKEVMALVQSLRELKILGDSKDLSAFVNLKSSKNGSLQRFNALVSVERGLFKILSERGKETIEVVLRELNQNLLDKHIVRTTTESVLRILDYWEVSGFITKKRLNRDLGIYQLVFKDVKSLEVDIKWRHPLARWTIGHLIRTGKRQNDLKDKEEVLVSFSILGLKDANSLMGERQESSTKRYETALLFLNRISAVKLEGGFMITYNKLNLQDVERDSKIRYENADYQKLDNFYLQKNQQIHIVGEYAKKSFQNDAEGQAFVDDYFNIEFEEFLSKYFKNRLTEIRRSMTPQRFAEIIKNLDGDQKKILEERKSKAALVLAGPGSGKTKVLVHKIAQMLLLEDVKPEQFMMLTFSKAASLEFRKRIKDLIPEYAGLIRISTFHGFCFELLGQLGNLEKLQNVISQGVELLKGGETDVAHITNKSVLLLDEFQDISGEEWELVQQIIKIAGDIRVFAVGDDDQNIYEFRGSSNSHLEMFREKYSAKQFSLLNNYRSVPSIVQFNNQYLTKIQDRLKDGMLKSMRRESRPGVTLFKYRSEHFLDAVVDDLRNIDLEGSKAVLVEKNEEALLMMSKLRSKGLKTKLIAGYDGFRASQLFEIREFTSFIEKQPNGLILQSDWRKAEERFKLEFSDSPHYVNCQRLIKLFDENFIDEKLNQDWLEFSREMRFEDIHFNDDSKILISTMHKVKGKEFDHVWMMHRGVHNFRVNYVAGSRARNTLRIHTTQDDFDQFLTPSLIHIDNSNYQAPTVYDFILTHKDIDLSSIKGNRVQERIGRLSSGQKLVLSEINFRSKSIPGFRNLQSEYILVFSKKFLSQTFKPLYSKGFKLVEAKVEYRVNWFDKSEETVYELILPKVRFKKG